jgi:hypothetical protein
MVHFREKFVSEQKGKLSVMRKIFREIIRPFKKISREIGRLLQPFVSPLTRTMLAPLIDELKNEGSARSIALHIVPMIQRRITAAVLHRKTFAGYKNKHHGQSVVLVGAGPSLNDFIPIDNAIYVGLNRACLYEKVKFDYLFTCDKLGIRTIYDKFAEYPCVKFVGDMGNDDPIRQIAESEVIKMKALAFKTYCDLYPDGAFCMDIESEPLVNVGTIALIAMQFILYTNPAVVYLVGCDSSPTGHFTQDHPRHWENLEDAPYLVDVTERMIPQWQKFKDFAGSYYPDTEIVSVNPVGLKGIFRDIYTNKEEKYAQ